jgi:methylmalonyl-CoA/ethylmalonyl-CoA epimerase
MLHTARAAATRAGGTCQVDRIAGVDVRDLHHVALAVDDLDGAIETYRRFFGANVELRERNEEQGVEAAYLRVGDGRIELVAPLAADTPVGRFLERHGPGMHHVALVVADVGAAVRELSAAGATVIDAEPRRGIGGHAVAFVHPESLHGVLAEVITVDE